MPTASSSCSNVSAHRMPRAVLALLALLLVLVSMVPGAAHARAAERDVGAEPVELVVYWGNGCPHCAALHEWLPEIEAMVPGLEVVDRVVWFDDANRQAFLRDAERLGFEASGVPGVILQERVWLGWSEVVAQDMRAAIIGASRGEEVRPGLFGTPGVEACDADGLGCAEQPPGDTEPAGQATGVRVDVPLVGSVDLAGSSLLASPLVIGLVDGINPCSLWVITVLLAIVVRTADRRRVLAVGGTFLVVTAAMYALYMAGIYSALAFVQHITTVQYVAAGIAGVFGVVSVKDYFAFKKGISFTIADSAKPGLYQRMRRAATSRSIVPALGATVVLGVVVSLLETPCTAGFPVLWTGMLHANGVSGAQAVALFGAYMVPFLLDELIIFGVVVVTMKATRMHEKHGQLLKLYAGVMMIALCVVMLVDATVMSRPVLALGLFVAAFVVATAVHQVTVRVRARTV